MSAAKVHPAPQESAADNKGAPENQHSGTGGKQPLKGHHSSEEEEHDIREVHDDGENLFHPGEAGGANSKGGPGDGSEPGALAPLDLDKVHAGEEPGQGDAEDAEHAHGEAPNGGFCGSLLTLIDGTWFNVIITIATVYALFGDDLRLWLTDKSADVAFSAVTIVALALFSFEFIVNCFARPYFACPPSFFFYLDLVATLSLVPDIVWVQEAISGGGTLSDVRAGRAARAGTRAGRIVRIIRLVRLVRILKLYKSVKNTGVLKRRRSSTLVAVGVDG